MTSIARARQIVPTSTRHVAGWARVAMVPLVAAIVIVGVWVTGGLVTDNELVAKALTLMWLGLAAFAAALAALRWRQVAWPVLGSYAVTAAVVGGFLLWSSTVDRVVVEDVTVAASGANGATQLSSGRFTDGAHATAGTASVIRRLDGTYVVTLTDFETSPGPDLRVYLVPGNGSDVVMPWTSAGSAETRGPRSTPSRRQRNLNSTAPS